MLFFSSTLETVKKSFGLESYTQETGISTHLQDLFNHLSDAVEDLVNTRRTHIRRCRDDFVFIVNMRLLPEGQGQIGHGQYNISDTTESATNKNKEMNISTGAKH